MQAASPKYKVRILNHGKRKRFVTRVFLGFTMKFMTVAQLKRQIQNEQKYGLPKAWFQPFCIFCKMYLGSCHRIYGKSFSHFLYFCEVVADDGTADGLLEGGASSCSLSDPLLSSLRLRSDLEELEPKKCHRDLLKH